MKQNAGEEAKTCMHEQENPQKKKKKKPISAIKKKKKDTHRKWKQEQATWEEQRDNVQTCRAGLMKAKSPPRAEFGEEHEGQQGKCLQVCQQQKPSKPKAPGTEEYVRSKEDLSSMEKDQVEEQLNRLDMHEGLKGRTRRN